MIIQNLGWTLIHSLWEGLVIYLALRVVIRFTNRSDVKYGISVAAMALTVVSSTATFFVLNSQAPSQGFNMVLNASQVSPADQPWSILSWVNSNIIWLIRFWVLGLTVGLLRIAAGLWYINRLRKNATPVGDEWMNIVVSLTQSLNINKVVVMAEAKISSPMVVGFMKPVILFPVGLLSGLTVEQVETILVHELAHIRRQDYIINLVQSVVETIFFFNPFVLLMSSLIREERENCCDDMVIAKGVNPISYVKTLAQLEAARSSANLALGIASNQNQLLNRIKRIMENSAKNDWSKGRLIPVALLFLGFICASWLTIGSESPTSNETVLARNVLASDTSKDRNENFKVYKRSGEHDSWVVIAPSEPLDESEFTEAMDETFDETFDHVFKESFENGFGMANFNFPAFENPTFDFDTLPEGYTYSFMFDDPSGKEEFKKEFTLRFKENFKDFYEKNQKEFDKMVENMWKGENRQMKMALGQMPDMAHLEDMARAAEEQAHSMQLMAEDVFVRSQNAQDAALEEMIAAEEARSAHEGQWRIMSDQFAEQEALLRDMEERSEGFKVELEKMLREDGYIGKEEEMTSFNINDNNGKLVINGRSIKEKDEVKYRALHDKYFESKWRTQRHGRSE